MNNKSAIGIALVGMGIFFLLQSLGILHYSFGKVVMKLLPFALIFFGARMIIKRKQRAEQDSGEIPPDFSSHVDYAKERESASGPRENEQSFSQKQSGASSAQHSTEDGKTRFTQFIGELHIDCDGLSLKSMEISGFIGEIEVNVSGGKLQSGLNRIIISNFIGDIRIFVPKGMPTFVHCSNFIGDIDIFGKRTSGFGNHIEGQTADYTTANDKLFIAVSSFISDIRVYSV